MYNTTCKKGKRCINPPDMLKVAIGKKPKKILIFLLWFKDQNAFRILFILYVEVFCIAKNSNDLLCNEQIKVSQVLVIGPNGEQMGVKNINDALTIASYAGLDLVLINGNSEPNVCKIMDYNKFKYEKAKKQKEALKKQKASNMELKEYRLSPVIDVGDFDTKVRNASKYLEKGHKVKLSIRFKGRQIAHPELAEEVLNKFASRVESFAIVEQKAKLEGRNMTMLLAPNTSK